MRCRVQVFHLAQLAPRKLEASSPNWEPHTHSHNWKTNEINNNNDQLTNHRRHRNLYSHSSAYKSFSVKCTQSRRARWTNLSTAETRQQPASAGGAGHHQLSSMAAYQYNNHRPRFESASHYYKVECVQRRAAERQSRR